ncbi:MAG: FAD-binding protein [Dongiales bacterium]
MSSALEPRTAAELAAAVLESAGPLEVLGAGSKRGVGRPVNSGQRLDLSHLSGISLYEPEELVLTAGAGTRLAEIEQPRRHRQDEHDEDRDDAERQRDLAAPQRRAQAAEQAGRLGAGYGGVGHM